MDSGGSGDWRSRGSREAIPNPVSQTWAVAALTRTLAGLMSLWISPAACTLADAPRDADREAQEGVHLHGRAGHRSSGSPPGSSSTSTVRPWCRPSATGRTAHRGSSRRSAHIRARDAPGVPVMRIRPRGPRPARCHARRPPGSLARPGTGSARHPCGAARACIPTAPSRRARPTAQREVLPQRRRRGREREK